MQKLHKSLLKLNRYGTYRAKETAVVSKNQQHTENASHVYAVTLGWFFSGYYKN